MTDDGGNRSTLDLLCDDRVLGSMLCVLLQRTLAVQASVSTGLLLRQAQAKSLTCLRTFAFSFARPYSVTQPVRTADGSLSFPVQQPPSRLTLLFPYSHAHVKVITGGYETVQVKVQGGTQFAAGGFDIEYDGAHVALVEQQGDAARHPHQKPGHKDIVALIPERYCHVDIHTAGGSVDVQSITEASLRVSSGTGAIKLGKVKASSVDLNTTGGHVQCQVLTADKAHVTTLGGSISIGRLVGQHCVLNARPTDGVSAAAEMSIPESGRGNVEVEVAYTESLQVNAGNSPVTFGFLDTMSGAASLMSEGNAVTVNGLDGAASVQSHGGAIQLKLQENLREVQAQSFGGIICCTLPPALRPISASLQPICNTTLAEDLQFKDGVLHNTGTSKGFAKQSPTVDQHGQEQQQEHNTQHTQALEANQPVAKLRLDASKPGHKETLAGHIHIAMESWLDRATAKAKAKMQERKGE